MSVTHYPQYRPKNMKNIQARWESFEMKLILSCQCHDLSDYGCDLTLLSFFFLVPEKLICDPPCSDNEACKSSSGGSPECVCADGFMGVKDNCTGNSKKDS